MGEPAQAIAPITAAERRAAILALPLRAEPSPGEEEAIFEEIEAEVAAGEPEIPYTKVPTRALRCDSRGRHGDGRLG